MKTYLVVLFFLLFNEAFTQEAAFISNNTSAERVTNKFSDLSFVSNPHRIAILRAVKSLDEKGIYAKLISLYIGKYFSNNRCYNLLAPLDYDGAFTLTVSSGAPVAMADGIQMHAGDKLNTHFINDLAASAPNLGVFWYTNEGVDKPIIYSASPFSVFPRDFDGKAYINIWSSSNGIVVADTSSKFNLAQRAGNRVEFYQDGIKYDGVQEINSPYPVANEVFIHNNGNNFTLKIFGITQALNEQEANDLRQILEKLIADLEL